jgi:alanine racemase
MKLSRLHPVQTRRDAWVEVNLSHLEWNARRLCAQLPPGCALMAVLKADAYGHGAVMVLPTLEAAGVSQVGVAAVDEGLALRRAGAKLPILVLGATPHWAMAQAAENQLQVTIFTRQHLAAIRQAGLPQPMAVHVKVDTGMRRIGVPTDEAIPFLAEVAASPWVRLEGIFTHLACAEDATQAQGVSQQQWRAWQGLLAAVEAQGLVLPRWRHVLNTAGLCHGAAFPANGAPTMNLARCGLGLFGYSEVPNVLKLRPVMGLKARVVHLQTLSSGQGISYGHRYHTPAGAGSTRVATLPLGYADGVPRGLSNRLQAVVRGVVSPQVGTITMDQLMLDVTAAADVCVGDTVTLLGDPPACTLDDWATALGSIPYELMCGLRVRLPKVYVR